MGKDERKNTEVIKNILGLLLTKLQRSRVLLPSLYNLNFEASFFLFFLSCPVWLEEEEEEEDCPV